MPKGITRREVLKLAAATGAAIALPGCPSPFTNDRGMRAGVAILRASYDNDLMNVVEQGFQLVPPPDVTGKRVLLKANLVDLPREDKPITTSPALLVAAAEAFRRRGAAEIIIGDGPALQRDGWQIVDAIGLTPLLDQHNLRFLDLNRDELTLKANAGSNTGIPGIYYPRMVLETDVLVSMPKMKTHHWAGVSLSMKNMFGTVSCTAYGWPRNTWHKVNLHNSVLDFNLTRGPDYAIIDGVVGLEGDGPVRGTPIDVGVIVMGDTPSAVDATAARIMGVVPERVDYLNRAAGVLGPIGEASIEQRGESIASVRTPFQMPSTQALIVI